MVHTLQLSNKWKLLLWVWPVCLVTFLLFNVMYIFSHCHLTVCDLDSKFPESSCSMAPTAVSSQNIDYGCSRPRNSVIQVSLPCFPQLALLLRWMTLEPNALNFSASWMTVQAAHGKIQQDAVVLCLFSIYFDRRIEMWLCICIRVSKLGAYRSPVPCTHFLDMGR